MPYTKIQKRKGKGKMKSGSNMKVMMGKPMVKMMSKNHK